MNETPEFFRRLTMNRAAVAANEYQTDTKRVLCLCSAGCLRSPTAANVLHEEFGYNTRSAGTTNSYALIVADGPLLSWAQEIVCVDEPTLFELMQNPLYEELVHDRKKPIIVLNVPDIHPWNHPELRKEISEQYRSRKEIVDQYS